MDNFLEKFLMEMALFVGLGLLYYFYQRKKILQYEANKGPIVMGYLLQAFLTEKGEHDIPEMSIIIEALDDFLHNRSSVAPILLLKKFTHSPDCSPEMKALIEESMLEMEK